MGVCGTTTGAGLAGGAGGTGTVDLTLAEGVATGAGFAGGAGGTGAVDLALAGGLLAGLADCFKPNCCLISAVVGMGVCLSMGTS